MLGSLYDCPPCTEQHVKDPVNAEQGLASRQASSAQARLRAKCLLAVSGCMQLPCAGKGRLLETFAGDRSGKHATGDWLKHGSRMQHGKSAIIRLSALQRTHREWEGLAAILKGGVDGLDLSRQLVTDRRPYDGSCTAQAVLEVCHRQQKTY